MDTGGWTGRDNGAHVAFAPRLHSQAGELRLSLVDPFDRAGQFTAVVAMPKDGA
jgi:hypothetical protein